MLSRPQKRLVIGVAVLVIVVLFVVPRINLSRYKSSVASSLSQALGHEVTVRDISLQTFPQPGLLLNGVVVADDPAISAEPMLRADSVLATLRFTSLWRGRLEISRLKLTEPSLNLARGENGRWNLESLLERARQTPAAPTAKTRPESRARFPYIEANNGRINVKIGQEKKVYALNEADFALWLASEDEWRMRLEARPIRTDANLSDTGTIKAEGSWRRAATLRETPLLLRLWWDYGQLGQLTSLIYGHDRGWRGSVRASAVIQGRPEDLKISVDGRLEDFRRYDIASGESVTLQGHCAAHYNFSTREVSDLNCQSPMGGGMVSVTGTAGIEPKQNLDLGLSAENISTQFIATLARRAKRYIPEDLTATGAVSAMLTVRAGDDGDRTWTGSGEASEIQLRSSVLTKPVILQASKWHLIGPGIAQASAMKTPIKAKPRARIVKEELPVPASTAFAFDPVSLDLGGTAPATLNGWFGREAYWTELKGEADIQRLIELSRAIGIPSTGAELSGNAKGKLDIAGEWSGFALPEITGSAQLNAVTAKLNGVAGPLRIQSAQFSADANSASLTKASGTFADVHTALDFSATWPRHCVASQPDDLARCGMQFNVKADQVNVDEINSLLNPRAQKRPWYAALANTVLGSSRKNLPEMYASGHVAIGKLVVKSVTATHATADVAISPKGFTISTLSADTFGGQFVGDIAADFTSGTPVYTSSGNLVNVAFGNVATLMHDAWASGKLTASYKGSSSGWSADEIIASAHGTSNFQWRDGVLYHLDLGSTGKPLQFKLFAGKVELTKGVFTISESKLAAPQSIYLVSGTASLGRELELKMARDGAPSFSVSGTLERPKVAPLKLPETQAALK